MYGLLFPEKDRIIMEIPIDMATPINIVFAVIRKKDAKKMIDRYADLNQFGEKMLVSKLNKKLLVLGEH